VTGLQILVENITHPSSRKTFLMLVFPPSKMEKTLRHPAGKAAQPSKQEST